MSKNCLLLSVGDTRSPTSLAGIMKRGIESQGYKVEQHHPQIVETLLANRNDIGIFNGLRLNLVDCRDAFVNQGKSAIIFDLGYLDRSDTKKPNGYYQLGLNRIGWVPDFKCPPDRFNNLGYTIKPLEDRDSNKVLVCGQKFGDGQHGMDEPTHKEFLRKTCERFQALGYEVDFRPHPKSVFRLRGFNSEWGTPLEEILGDYKFIVTYNSTSGVEAIINGTPVVALAPDVHYREVCANLDENGSVSLPSEEQVKDYFHRLAYAQWKREEMVNGYPFFFLLKVINCEDPFTDDMCYTELQPVQRTEDPFRDLSELSWPEQQRLVKEVTGVYPRSRVQLEIQVDAWYHSA